MEEREPIFNVPAIVVAVLALLAGVHMFRGTLQPEADSDLVLSLAFIPARYTDVAVYVPGGDLALWTSPFTYGLVHADATHLLLNSAWLLAFGSIVARRIGAIRFVAFMLAASGVSALAFFAVHPGLPVPVVGASGAIAALMGGVMRFLFSALDRGEGWKLRAAPDQVPALSVLDTLRHPKVLTTTAIFIALNVLALIGFGTAGVTGQIAWEAHIGGYMFGLLAFGLFDVPPRLYSPSPNPDEM